MAETSRQLLRGEMTEAKKHHFLPVFYLKQWAGADHRLVEFKRPYAATVKPRRTHPQGTGWIDKLYALEGVAGEAAVEFETQFLSPVDSRAAEALAVMRGETPDDFTPEQRMAWASFICSLLARMPDDIAKLKKYVRSDWLITIPGLIEAYQQNKAPSDPDTIQEYIARTTDPLFEEGAMAVGRRVMAHEGVTRGIAGMGWSILSVEQAKHELLTSDRPVLYTDLFGHKDSHLAMPIGPRHIFFAAKERRFVEQIKGENSQDGLVAKMNQFIVENANSYVYGSTDAQLRYVQNRMGKNRVPSLIDRLHNYRMSDLNRRPSVQS